MEEQVNKLAMEQVNDMLEFVHQEAMTQMCLFLLLDKDLRICRGSGGKRKDIEEGAGIIEH